ncbi:hypothetical protein LguiA_013556 [Lonicera macranthoides]
MALLGYFEIISAFLFFCLFWYLSHDNSLPRNYPLFGMLPELIIYSDEIHQACTNILSKTGGTFLFKGPWFANMDMLATVDPSNIHYIMSSNFPNFPKGPEFMKIFDILGDGIFNSDYELWRSQRKLARVLINHHRFHRFLARISRDKVEDGLIPVLDHVAKQGMIVDLQDLFQRLTFDTTCRFVTGYDPGCLSVGLPEVPFSRAMDDAEETIFVRHVVPESFWKLQRWLRVGQEKKMCEAWKTLDQVIGEYIEMKRKELSKGTQPTSKEDSEGIDLLT